MFVENVSQISHCNGRLRHEQNSIIRALKGKVVDEIVKPLKLRQGIQEFREALRVLRAWFSVALILTCLRQPRELVGPLLGKPSGLGKFA